jgi:hypothetical protein
MLVNSDFQLSRSTKVSKAGEFRPWFLANCLTLHSSKTCFMLFSHSIPDSNLHLILMGEPILRVHEKGAMSLIRRAKHFLPTSIILLLYKALVLCHLSYCNSIWGGAAASTLKPLVTLKKKQFV